MSTPALNRVLLVCTGNTCRSPMAEGLLKLQFQPQPGIEIFSAGIQAVPGAAPSLEAVVAARELGIDIHRHRAQLLDQSLLDRAGLVITMTVAQARWIQQLFPTVQGKVFSLGSLAASAQGRDVADPIGESLDTYRQTVRQIAEWLGEAGDEILRRL